MEIVSKILNIDYEKHKKEYEEKQLYTFQLQKFFLFNNVDQIFQDYFFQQFRKKLNIKENNNSNNVNKTLFIVKIHEGIDKILEDMDHNIVISNNLMFEKNNMFYKYYIMYLNSFVENKFITFKQFQKNIEKHKDLLNKENNIPKDIIEEIYDTIQTKVLNNDLQNLGLNIINSHLKKDFDLENIMYDDKYLDIIPEVILILYHITMYGICNNKTYEENSYKNINFITKYFNGKINYITIIILLKVFYTFFSKLSLFTSRESLRDSVKFRNKLKV